MADTEEAPPPRPLTRTEIELHQATLYLERLTEKANAEAALLAAVSPRMRALAIALHNQICTDDHPVVCNWISDPMADDPERADWSGNDAHKKYLFFTVTAVDIARREGWTIAEPL